MDNIWQILGIAPTDSKKEIRKAYSAKTKQIHPVEKPEEFQQLKNAYESAIRLSAKPQNTYEQHSLNYSDVLIGEIASYQYTPIEYSEEESLLEKLEENEANSYNQMAQDSRAYSILEKIDELLSDTKRRKNKVELRQLFLTDEFLDVQYDSEFTECLRQYLMQQKYTQYQELPQLFLIELMNAYGLSAGILAEYEGASTQEKAVMLDDAQRNIANIWSGQNEEWRTYRGIRILDKNENIVRGKAFADYCKLLKYQKMGFLRKQREEVWGDDILICGIWENIVEDKCKESDYEGDRKRNICFLRLLAYFLQHHKVDEDVCAYMYKHYQINGMKGRYYERFYTPIQEEILKQHPHMEQRMEEERREKEAWMEWKKHFYAIGRENYASLFSINKPIGTSLSYHTEDMILSREIDEKVEKLLKDPVFERHMYESDFIEKVISWVLLYGIPSAVNGLYEEYMREDRTEKSSAPIVKQLLDGLVMKKGFWHMYEETDCYQEYEYDLSLDSYGFWVYYLMYAYGNPHVSIPTEEKNNYYYAKCGTRENERYLVEYIKNYYFPSKEWCIRFTGMNRETGEILNQKTECISLEDNRSLLVKYGPNNINFYCEDRQINEAILTWEQLKEEKDTRRFLILLALTKIEETERKEAREIIAKHLLQIQICKFSIPFMSECLANDNGRDGSAKQESHPYIERNKGDLRECMNVAEMTNLEKIEEFLAMLKRNQRAEEEVNEYLERTELPEYMKEAYRMWSGLANNHVLFHWGNQNRDFLYPMCVTGLFGIGESVQSYSQMTNYTIQQIEYNIKEKSFYPLGWVWLQNSMPTIIFLGESGTYYTSKEVEKNWQADTLPELLVKSMQFTDVTELMNYEKKVSLVRYGLSDGAVYRYQ